MWKEKGSVCEREKWNIRVLWKEWFLSFEYIALEWKEAAGNQYPQRG